MSLIDGNVTNQISLSPLFISIEGGEGAGKTTFSKALVEALRKSGRTVIHTREPGGTPEGEKFRSSFLAHTFSESELSSFLENSWFLGSFDDLESNAFLKIRMEHLIRLIIPALFADNIVVCERFHDSTVVYQGFAKTGNNSDVTRMNQYCFNAMNKLNEFYKVELNNLPQNHFLHCFSKNHFLPHLTFLLDISPEEGLKRKENQGSLDRLELKGLEFHTRVYHGFKLVALQNPERVYVINAIKSTEEMVQMALDKLLLKHPPLIYG